MARKKQANRTPRKEVPMKFARKACPATGGSYAPLEVSKSLQRIWAKTKNLYEFCHDVNLCTSCTTFEKVITVIAHDYWQGYDFEKEAVVSLKVAAKAHLMKAIDATWLLGAVSGGNPTV